MEDYIAKFVQIIKSSDNIVFFGGAGVSTPSGIPDFRSVDGIYNSRYVYPPEVILSHSFFTSNTEEFYRFYRDKMLYTDALPNDAHLSLAKLEQMGKLRAVITQNIDNLHQKAGSKEVLELHGTVYKNHCTKCGESYSIDVISSCEQVPMCKCGGVIKPDVVLYEEQLDGNVLKRSIEYITSAKVLIIGGTSLAVYPAAGLIQYYKGDKLVLINRDKTPADSRASLVINDDIAKVFKQVMELV